MSSPGFSRSQAETVLNTPENQAVIDTTFATLPNFLGTGTSYGLSVTYDFKSPDSKIVGYVGPRILLGTASGSGNVGGTAVNTSTIDTSIGLTAGADYAISDNFTAGASATYNFSRSSKTTVTTPVGSQELSNSGGNFNFGINVGYSF